MTLTTKDFNQLWENFIAFDRQNDAASCREHADSTENDKFEAMLARLVLENFTGDRELGKVFFASDPDLPVAEINNLLKA